MSTTADVCPFCLRHEGYDVARSQGVRFCPLCGSDWRTLEPDPDAVPWREDSVVIPVPRDLREGAPGWNETGPLPALSDRSARAAAAGALRLTTPPVSPGAAEFSDPNDFPDPSEPDPSERDPNEPPFPDDTFPQEDATVLHRPLRPLATWPLEALSPESTEPAVAPPPPEGSTWALVLGAAGAVALVAIGLITLSDVGLGPAPLPSAPTAPTSPQPSTAPPTPATQAAAAGPSLPPLPSPRTSPERRSAAVKEHIEQALAGQPESVQAEVGVRVDEGVAYLIGTVDSATTRDLVATAAGQAFGIKAVDTRDLKLEVRPPPVHVVLPGETLSALARRLYGRGGEWRRIYEMNPGIDPNVIRVGQPLSLPPATPAGAP